jgi:hypothetical protein
MSDIRNKFVEQKLKINRGTTRQSAMRCVMLRYVDH